MSPLWVNRYRNELSVHVRFTPDSDRTADINVGPVRAQLRTHAVQQKTRAVQHYLLPYLLIEFELSVAILQVFEIGYARP
jgi:hypothetical protein